MPPFVFLHGMWCSPALFNPLRDELAAVGLASHAVPLRAGGDGAADRAAPRLGDYVATVTAALAACEAADGADGSVILVGHSLGGLIAQRVAANIGRKTVKALVLLAPAPSAQTLRCAIGPALLPALAAFSGMLGRRGWWRTQLPPDRRALEKLLFHDVPATEADAAFAALVPESGAVLAQIVAPWFDRSHESRVDYGRLALPVLLITGEADRVVPPAVARATARHLAAAGATVDYEEWPDVGHWLFHDAVRPRLAAALARFAASQG